MYVPVVQETILRISTSDGVLSPVDGHIRFGGCVEARGDCTSAVESEAEKD
jgi:hypothetical protein